MNTESRVIGRYAPSPTGDLHLGNLRTALLAWLQARTQGGGFLLRMEDLDLPRVVKGCAEAILRDLEWLGIDWDGEVVYQSQRTGLYQAALDSLEQQSLTYPCFCSRKDIQSAASAPHQSTAIYSGTCAVLSACEVAEKRQAKKPAIRLRISDQLIEFDDTCFGKQSQQLSQEVGDFVIKRADGLFAYQLAVVVDDLDQGVSDVVRGADLISSTTRQIYLSRLLGASQFRYCHVPLMLDDSGNRMAKRDGSQSAEQWRTAGKTAEQLLGLLANSVGLAATADAISSNDLLDSLDYQGFLRNIRLASHNQRTSESLA